MADGIRFRIDSALTIRALSEIDRRANRLLDVAQSILAEEDLVPDEEGRRPEGAARDRAFGVGQELVLDLAGLDQLEQSPATQAGFLAGRGEHGRVVHLLGIGPHVPEHLVDVALEHAERYGWGV